MRIEILLDDVKKIRDQREFSYRRLSKETRINHVVLWRIINGRVDEITFQNLNRLLKFHQKWRHIINEDTDS